MTKLSEQNFDLGYYVESEPVEYWLNYKDIKIEGHSTVASALKLICQFLDNNYNLFTEPNLLDIGIIDNNGDDGDWCLWLNPDMPDDLDYIIDNDINAYIESKINGNFGQSTFKYFRQYYLELAIINLINK